MSCRFSVGVKLSSSEIIYAPPLRLIIGPCNIPPMWRGRYKTIICLLFKPKVPIFDDDTVNNRPR